MPVASSDSASIRTAPRHRPAWTVVVAGLMDFEVWGAADPLAPRPDRQRYLARFSTEARAEATAALLNEIWDRLRLCRDMVQETKTGETDQARAVRYRKLEALLSEAMQAAAEETQRITPGVPDQVSRVFGLYHRTLRECAAVLVRYRHEKHRRYSFARLLRISRTIEETGRQLSTLYGRKPRR